jgi:drug/metabolite transporter (DMT)-like permease
MPGATNGCAGSIAAARCPSAPLARTRLPSSYEVRRRAMPADAHRGPPVPEEPRPADAPRARLLSTSSGTHLEAFALRDWALLATIALIWGSSFVLMDIGLESFEPGVITFARIALGGATLALVPRARRTRIDREDLPRTVLLGAVWMAIPLSLFPIAQQWVDSSVAGMINGGMPLATGAWATLLLWRLPPRVQAIGLVLGFTGIVAIFVPEIPSGAGNGRALLGAALCVLAITCYGLAANLAVPLQQKYGSLPLLLRTAGVGLVMTAPFALRALPGSTFSWSSALAMLPLGMLGTGLAFVLMTTLVGRVGGTRGSTPIYFVPVVAILIGVVFRGEHVHPLAVAGSVLVVGGAWMASRRERPNAPATPTPGG